MGYSLVDTANAYVNERAVGRGIKDSGVKRENVFLSTKLWPSEYENPNAVDETLERLGVDYVDLLYIHQPAVVFCILSAVFLVIGLSLVFHNDKIILLEIPLTAGVIVYAVASTISIARQAKR